MRLDAELREAREKIRNLELQVEVLRNNARKAAQTLQLDVWGIDSIRVSNTLWIVSLLEALVTFLYQSQNDQSLFGLWPQELSAVRRKGKKVHSESGLHSCYHVSPRISPLWRANLWEMNRYDRPYVHWQCKYVSATPRTRWHKNMRSVEIG